MALKGLNDELDSRDIAFITHLTNSVLENLSQIDYILSGFIGEKRIHRQIRIILRMAVCEIEFLKTPERAAVNENVGLCKEIGKHQLTGFVNAVLRNYLGKKKDIEYPNIDTDLKEYLTVFSGYGRWFIDEIIADYGEDFAKEFLLYKDTHKGESFVRLNTLKGEKAKIINTISQNDLEFISDPSFTDGGYIKNLTSVQNRAIFQNGKIAVQGKASMLSVMIGGVSPNMTVLDACAAPGGKTAHIATIMQNKGAVTAFDIHAHRVSLINKNMERLGVSIVDAKQKDASEFDVNLKEKFDIVFLDMPCSSMGLAYKKADVRIFKKEDDVKNLAKIQKSILNIAKSYVKHDGILMYITCSITKAETDLTWFFKKNKDYEAQEMEIPSGIDYIKAEYGIKLFPHISDMDGFFICKIIRK